MDGPGNNSAPPSGGPDGVGVRVTELGGRRRRQSLLYKALAVVLVGGCAVYLLTTMSHRPPPSGEHRDSDTQAIDGNAAAELPADSQASTGQRERAVTARPAQSQRDPNDLAQYLDPGQPAPPVEDVIDRLHQAGIYSGIGAFQPPGTSPPMIGLAVPDDYVLPEGYVRHFQATDDGQRIEPILMYSPDFEFFDSAGRRIEIPENRVVPPGMAPPGLVARPIKIPPPLQPGSP
jgi:hypothetical protein